MSLLHDILHGLADKVTYASQAQREAAHDAIDDLPDFLEHPGEDQLAAETGTDDDGQDVAAATQTGD